jgi:hypothetical protein
MERTRGSGDKLSDELLERLARRRLLRRGLGLGPMLRFLKYFRRNI